MIPSKKDNGGTRSGTDRRKFSVINYTHERRSGMERRKGVDRRRSQITRAEIAIERRDIFRKNY